jgi:hypothetical protein
MSLVESLVMEIRPRWARIAGAVEYSGIGRSKLYEYASGHPGLFRKDGKSVIVDLDLLDRIIGGFKVAQIKPSRRMTTKSGVIG